MKVLLANIPWYKDNKSGVRAGSRWPHLKDPLTEKEYLPFPFFLSYAASLLERNNIEVELVDAIAENFTEKKFSQEVNKFSPDLLVAEVSTVSLENDLRILKRISKKVKIAICGPDVNIRKPEFLKNNTYIDYVLMREYEYTLLDLVKHLENKESLENVLGLIYFKNDKYVINSVRPLCNFDDLPWPLRESLPMNKYWDLPGNIPFPSVQMLASRGCPFKCNFCLWPQVMYGSNEYRVRDPKNVVDEMEYLVRKKGFKSVYFDDDTFNIGKKRILNICSEIRKRGLHEVPWAIMARADLMDRELLETMKAAGLHSVKYGVETASQELLDRCGKSLDLKKAEKIIKLTKFLGIKIHLTFLFGLEGETKETIKRTIDYSLKLKPDSVQYTILTPFPGTILFEELDRQGKILTKDWSLYDGHYSCVFQPDNLSSTDLVEARQYAYRRWGDYQRRKRGLFRNIKRFFDYWQNYGFISTYKKMINYLSYIFFHRKRFIGRL